MSYVAFHFAEGEVLHLRGMERGYLGHLADSTAVGAIGLTAGTFGGVGRVLEQIYPFLDKDFHQGWPPSDKSLQQRFADNLQNSFFDRPLFSWKGKAIATWPLMLNTALAVGSSPIRMAAKIHATCEIHGRIEGPDRAWVADVIEEGLRSCLYRPGFFTTKNPMAELIIGSKQEGTLTEEDKEQVFVSMGWTEIVEQLRKSDQGAVVMSYSVTDGFPDPPKEWMPTGTPPEDWDQVYDWRWEEWGDLSYEEQFRLALDEIKATSGNASISKWTELNLFQHELNLFDLIRGDIPKIEKCLKITPEVAE
jgi:hypothetical protein